MVLVVGLDKIVASREDAVYQTRAMGAFGMENVVLGISPRDPERPTEIEAYRYTVQEARRLGLSDERICEYLKTEWMSDEDLKILSKAVNVTCD